MNWNTIWVIYGHKKWQLFFGFSNSKLRLRDIYIPVNYSDKKRNKKLLDKTTFNLIAFGRITFDQMSTRSNGNQEYKLQEILYKNKTIIILSKNLSGQQQQPIVTDWLTIMSIIIYIYSCEK